MKRWELAAEHQLCVNCFKSGHVATKCNFSGCKVCVVKHNTLLHMDLFERKQSDSAEKAIIDDGPENRTKDRSFETSSDSTAF